MTETNSSPVSNDQAREAKRKIAALLDGLSGFTLAIGGDKETGHIVRLQYMASDTLSEIKERQLPDTVDGVTITLSQVVGRVVSRASNPVQST